MRPHEMSAVALLDAYRRRELSPVEAMRDVLERVARFEPHIHATYLLAPERALADARASEARWARGEPIGPLDGVPTTIKDNIATKGEPKPLGTAASDLTPAAADAPPAARLREAGAILFAKTTMPDYGMLSSGLSSFHPLDPQSLEPRAQSRRLLGGRGRGGGGGLRPAASRHRHRRLGAAAGGLVRPVRPEAERRARADRSALYRPRRRADDAQRRRRRADDGDAFAARRARLHEPAAARRSTGRRAAASLRGLRIGLLLEAGCGGPVDAGSARGDRARRARFRGGRRDRRAAGAVPHAGHARRARSVLAHALADRHRARCRRSAARKCCPSSAPGRNRRAGFRGEVVFHGFSQILEMRKRRGRGDAAVRLRAVADRADDRLSGRTRPRRATIR